jgi:hypothetical protein
MGGVPSISSSISTAFSRGFAAMDQAAVEMTSENAGDSDIINGVRDESMARMDVGAGTILLKTYRQMIGGLLDVMG